MVLVSFFGAQNRDGIQSCTIYKIPVNFSLSLDMKQQMVQKISVFFFGQKILGKNWKKGNTSKGVPFFRENFPPG